MLNGFRFIVHQQMSRDEINSNKSILITKTVFPSTAELINDKNEKMQEKWTTNANIMQQENIYFFMKDLDAMKSKEK